VRDEVQLLVKENLEWYQLSAVGKEIERGKAIGRAHVGFSRNAL
jgi:hypothetical protein